MRLLNSLDCMGVVKVVSICFCHQHLPLDMPLDLESDVKTSCMVVH
jgi:hypothetical protein